MLTRAKRAFTLLELIVVIVILGILAALAIPTFASVISKSETQGAKTAAEAVGRNAVALAAFDRSAPTYAHLTAAAGETGGAVEVVSDDLAGDSIDHDDDALTADIAVPAGSALLDVDGVFVLIALPTQVNGAATVTPLS